MAQASWGKSVMYRVFWLQENLRHSSTQILLSKLELANSYVYSDGWPIISASVSNNYVCINSSNSNKLLVTSGVPQGSVLGPILLLIPPYSMAAWHFMLMILWYSDHSKHLKTLPYYSLTLIASHLGLNKFLQFNADKRKYIVITRKRQTNLSLEFQPPLLTNGATIVWGRPGCIPFRLPPLQKHKKGKE